MNGINASTNMSKRSGGRSKKRVEPLEGSIEGVLRNKVVVKMR